MLSPDSTPSPGVIPQPLAAEDGPPVDREQKLPASTLVRGLQWSLGLMILAALGIAIGVAEYRRQRVVAALAELEDVGGVIVRAERLARTLNEPALDYVMRGTDPITRMRISRLPKTPADWDKLLEAIRKLPDLQSLRIERTTLSDEDAARFFDMQKLDSLNVGYTKITNATVAELTRFPKLNYIVLDGTAVTDDCLPDLLRCERLEMVSLENTQVTGTGFLECAKFKKLNRIYVSQSMVTPEDITKFQAARPDVRLIVR